MPHFFAVWYSNPSNKGVSLQARNSVIYSLSAHSAQPSLTDSILGIDGAVWLQLDERCLESKGRGPSGICPGAREAASAFSGFQWPCADHSMGTE